jgi:hypothetical protein
MHPRLLPVLAAAAALALPASAAHAAQPKSGYYEGSGVFFKIAKFGERPQLARLSLSEPLTCADGSTIQDTLDTIIILGPKVNRYGRFRYEKPGSTLFKGRFVTRTKATGTLTRTVGDCTASMSWTASLRTGGIPIPTA